MRLFDVMPTTTEDGIQYNGDENMEDQIQNNANENMVKYDSIISSSTSNSLLIQPENNFVEVSPETLTPFHFVANTQNYISTDIQCNVSSTPNFDPIVSPYTLPPRTNRRQPPVKYEPILNCKVKYSINNYVSYENLSKSYVNFVSQLSTVFTPSSLQEALADSRWIQAMKTEMEALEKNATWELVALPDGKSTVGCRWIFTVKHKADGSVE